MIKRTITAVVFLLLILPSAAFTGELRVVRVTDVDTIKAVNNGAEIIVRLVGIDAPETSKKKNEPGQPYSRKATQYLASLLLNKTITMTGYGNDRYGRILGVVFVNGTNANIEMVKAGLAEVYRGKPAKGLDLDPYWKAEAAARKAGKGIWALGSLYISPNNYRSTKDSDKIHILDSIKPIEFIVVPKINFVKFKTNKFNFLITIDNQSIHDIFVKVKPRLPNETELKALKDKYEIKPNKVENISFTLVFKNPYRGHIPSSTVEIFSDSGELIRNHLTRASEINLHWWNMPLALFVTSLLIQFASVTFVTGIIGKILSIKFRLSRKMTLKYCKFILLIMIIIVVIYDLVQIFKIINWGSS